MHGLQDYDIWKKFENQETNIYFLLRYLKNIKKNFKFFLSPPPSYDGLVL